MNPQETVVWKGSPSQWVNFGTYFFWLLVAAAIVVAYFLTQIGPLVFAALALPAAVVFGRWLLTRSHGYEITTERIRVSTGLLSRRTVEYELYRVRDYTLVEPFWLRLVGRGDIVLETADRTNPQCVIRAVPEAAKLKDRIRAETERLRQIRGVRDIEINPP